jgi:hypothetical protein
MNMTKIVRTRLLHTQKAEILSRSNDTPTLQRPGFFVNAATKTTKSWSVATLAVPEMPPLK